MTKSYKKYKNLIFILPVIILNIAFFLIPLGQSGYMSLFNWELLGEKTFLGVENYIQAFQDTQFLQSLKFTMEYALLVTPMLFIVAFAMTLLVNNRFRGVGIFRTIYFLPVIISMTACSDIWLWIYNELHGVLNYILLSVGLIQEPIAWMLSPETSLPAICIMVTWKMAGFTMLMLLSAFQAIDSQIYEAANIDGANRVRCFFRITLPLIRPTLALSLIISVIGSVLAFEQFKIMTNGGPSSSTLTAVYYTYNTSFRYFHFGYGSAMSVILLVILVILSYFQMKIMPSAEEG